MSDNTLRPGEYKPYEEIHPSDAPKTKVCPVCGKNMIKQSSGYNGTMGTLMSWDWWCGGCGNREPGGRWVEKTPEEYRQEAWQKAQLPDEPTDTERIANLEHQITELRARLDALEGGK